jgi:hypothetical protein
MWREIAAAELSVARPPAEVVEELRQATDPRLFPPSHRWSPRGLFLATVATEGDRFHIVYYVLRSRFRAHGSVTSTDGVASLVRVTLTEDPWSIVISTVCFLAGTAILALAWAATDARILGGWLLFMAAMGVGHLYTARSRARSMIQALAAFWRADSEQGGVAR